MQLSLMSHLMAKSQLLFFRGRECVFSNLNIYVCGQLEDMCDSATHLGHFIASTDKKSIVKSAKSCFWRSLNIFMSDFGQLSNIVKCKFLNQYCCSFYGSPLWSLKSTIVEYMCVDWRKALRFLSLKKRFIKFISACLSTSNCIVKIITEIALCNPMSCSGNNYRELLDGKGTFNLEPCFLSWKYNLTNLRNDMYTFKELIDIRDGIKECNGFTKAEISRFVLNICTH